MNTNNEEVLKENNEAKASEVSSSLHEMENVESNIEDTDDFTCETVEEAEIAEDLETIEILESEREKDMKRKAIKLQEEQEKLQNELNELKDKLLRTTAEYENFRRRSAKEKEGIYADACTDVLKEVLPALDNLERALAVKGCSEDLRVGVEMTVRQFGDAFSKLGVEELASEGKFDPNFHDAVMHIEDEAHGENEIVEVLRKGYKKGNKVLRHSMVKVAN